MSIPPKGWGAVESVIWDYKTYLEKLGHKVVIINTKEQSEIIDTINRWRPDVVHLHQHDLAGVLNKIRVPVKLFTSHSGYHVNKPLTSWFLYKHLLQYLREGLFVLVMSPAWRKVFLDCGYHPAEVFVALNGADHHRFRFRKTPPHKDRTIYLGSVTRNKRQHLYQAIDSVDFVGPVDEAGQFDTTRSNYLGEWSRDTLYEHLSDYANLAILSEVEVAAPLVVLEALVCGLGVVVSPAASVNLDTTLPWVSVIPREKLADAGFVEAEIARNREISLRHRECIRAYGIDNFSWEKLIPRYADLCRKLHAERTSRPRSCAADTLGRLRYLLPVLPASCLYIAYQLIFRSIPHRMGRLLNLKNRRT